MDVYLTALESRFPPLMGLDNAASRSLSSSSSKNPSEGPGWWRFDSWFEIFEEITKTLEELVVRFKLAAAVVDEAVRGKE